LKSRRPGIEEPETEPKERTMAVLKLTAGLGLTEGGIKMFEVIYRPRSEKQPHKEIRGHLLATSRT
jgi:hypothetical protein